VTEQLRTLMRRDLMTALKAKDAVATTAIRSLLAAIDNVEAPPADSHSPEVAQNEHIAGSAVGLGAAEIERRQLTDADLQSVIEAEIQERSTAATEYERLGRDDHAGRLRAEAEVLQRYVISHQEG